MNRSDTTTPPRLRPRHRQRAIPWLIVGFWVVLVAVAVPLGGKLGGVTSDSSVDYLPSDAQSTQVAELQERLPGGNTTDMLLVYHRDGGLTDADRTVADQQAGAVADHYDLGPDVVTGVPSDDGTTLMYPISLSAGQAGGEGVDVKTVRDLVADAPDGLAVEVAGPAGLEADADEVFESIDMTLIMATTVVVTVLLIFTYRSPILWLVPLVVVGVSVFTSMAAVYILVDAFDLTVSTMSSSIMIILVFGAGTDYALLLVARYRAELHRHHTAFEAMVAALRRSGPAVLASAGTVVAGLICLLAADLNSIRGLGPVGAVGIVCSLAAMMTLLPAILVILGRRVFWPLVPKEGTEPPARRGFYERVGALVTRRPVPVVVASVAGIGLLVLGIFNLPGDLREEDSFTSTPESVTGMQTLAAAFPEQSSQPVVVLARTDHADEVANVAESTEGVAQVEQGRDGDGWTELSVFAVDEPESAGEAATIERLRADLAAVDGADALVGGSSAETLDVAETTASDRTVVIPLVLASVFLVLALLLRSLIAPLVLIAAVVLVWGAALGLGGLIFGPVFGFEGTEPGVPLVTFVFLVALGVDYGIFLMHRMREERANDGESHRRATVRALSATGGVIASAGIVLAATFTVLAVLPLVMMVEIGFVIAVGVLLDTFLVRTFLVPAVATLLGDKLWWPGRLSKKPATTSAQPPAAVLAER